MQQDLLDWLLLNYGQETMRPGLERIHRALLPLLPRFKKTKIITIAGTNGKGETTLRLSEELGNRTHFIWTSPHITRLTERFRNESGEIDFLELKEIISECHEKVLQEKYELSFYEFLFFVFCSWAHKSAPEYLLLEVGLGGRLDAVNVFDADLVLLPSVSRDHQEILGTRYDKILMEKLGVLRTEATLISYLDLGYLRERALKVCENLNSHFIDLEESFSIPRFEFSQRNQLLATAAFYWLNRLPFESLKRPKTPSPLEHRGEILNRDCDWYLFGSHNVDGMRKLIQFLHSGTYNFSRPPFDAVIVTFSQRKETDLKIMTAMLKASGLGKVVLTNFPHPKAASKETMEALSQKEGFDFAEDIEEYIQGWSNRRILVTGSYYFLGHFKTLLGRR